THAGRTLAATSNGAECARVGLGEQTKVEGSGGAVASSGAALRKAVSENAISARTSCTRDRSLQSSLPLQRARGLRARGITLQTGAGDQSANKGRATSRCRVDPGPSGGALPVAR